MRILCGSLLLALTMSVTCYADVMTFNVDLGGENKQGETLRVFGFITLDPDLPVGAAIVNSSLQLQFEDDPLLDLPSIPEYEGPGNIETSLDWRVEDGNLFIDRLSNESTGAVWAVIEQGPTILSTFQLAAGPNPHGISYFNEETGGIGVLTLKPAGGPDPGVGFLVGTQAIPEPGMGILLAGLMGCVLRRRR